MTEKLLGLPNRPAEHSCFCCWFLCWKQVRSVCFEHANLWFQCLWHVGFLQTLFIFQVPSSSDVLGSKFDTTGRNCSEKHMKNISRIVKLDCSQLYKSSSFKSICSTLCQTLCKMKNNASCYSFWLSWRDKMELILLLGKRGFPDGSVGKESTCSAGNPSLIPGSRRSPGEGNGNPLQYSCLKNPRDRGAWRGAVRGVTKSQMRLSNK